MSLQKLILLLKERNLRCYGKKLDLNFNSEDILDVLYICDEEFKLEDLLKFGSKYT